MVPACTRVSALFSSCHWVSHVTFWFGIWGHCFAPKHRGFAPADLGLARLAARCTRRCAPPLFHTIQHYSSPRGWVGGFLGCWLVLGPTPPARLSSRAWRVESPPAVVVVEVKHSKRSGLCRLCFIASPVSVLLSGFFRFSRWKI